MLHSQFDNIVKANVRKVLFSSLPKKSVKNLLTLPGPDCLCVKHLLKHKVINKKTTIFFVEKERKYISQINSQLHRLGFEPSYYNMALHKIDLCYAPYFDVAFVDCCGQLTPQIEQWIKNQLFPGVTEDSSLFYTFIGYPERYPYLQSKNVSVRKIHYLRGICQTFGDINTTFPNTNVCYQVASRLWDIHHTQPKRFIMHKAPKAKYTMVSLEF